MIRVFLPTPLQTLAGTGREVQLTTDGIKDFGYATDNAGWIHSDRPVLAWSDDSKKIADALNLTSGMESRT